MFSAARVAVRPVVAAVSPVSLGSQTRNMATLKEIQMRLKAVQNISKITASMKMIASTKVARAQRSMEHARAYGSANNDLFTNMGTQPSEDGVVLYVTASSDRGLCGGIHSSVTKATRQILLESPEAEVVVLGDKAKAQLSRTHRDCIKLSFNQLGKDIPTFAEASAIADVIQESGLQFDSVEIVYNKFVSVIAYEADNIKSFSEEAIKNSSALGAYEYTDEILANLQEFSLANNIYWALVEGHAAEMAAKRSAMENATKNAGDMIQRLTLAYNRGRQAVITNELIDIITGASAL